VRGLGEFVGVEANDAVVGQIAAEAIPKKLGYLTF
jgi:hypothetical protein